MEAAAKAGKETTEVGAKRRRMAAAAAGEADDMVLETAVAAAAAALLVSVLKTLLQCVLGAQRPGLVPSPFLFLLLQLVIASIVFVSTHRTANGKPAAGRKAAEACRSAARREAGTARCALTAASSQGKKQQQQQHHEQPQYRACRRRRERRGDEDGPGEKEVAGDGGGCAAEDELINARAEAFISAFRQHLKLDSMISSNSRCGRRASRAASFRY